MPNVIRLFKHIAILVVAVSAFAFPSASPANATSWCMGCRWYATSQSGSGTNTGTAAITSTWSSWYAPSPSGFSDEAVWSISTADGTALEGGFFTGLGNNVSWTNGMMPYYTINNGQNEYDNGKVLPTNSQIMMEAQTAYNGNPASVYVGGWTLHPGNYTVTAPRLNYMQGEVGNSSCAWMGGGTGETFFMYYQPVNDYPSTWINWGWMSTGVNSPYWRTVQANSEWTNGGKGNC